MCANAVPRRDFAARRRFISFVLFDFLNYLISQRFLSQIRISQQIAAFRQARKLTELEEETYDEKEEEKDFASTQSNETFDIHRHVDSLKPDDLVEIRVESALNGAVISDSSIFVDSCWMFCQGLKPGDAVEIRVESASLLDGAEIRHVDGDASVEHRRVAFIHTVASFEQRDAVEPAAKIRHVFATRQFLFNSTAQSEFVGQRYIKSFSKVKIPEIPTATEIQIARIETLDGDDLSASKPAQSRLVDEMLRDHFIVKRLLYSGDVFSIGDYDTNAHIYFKVVHIKAENEPRPEAEPACAVAFAQRDVTRCVECAPARGATFFGRRVNGAQFLSRSLRDGVDSARRFFARAFCLKQSSRLKMSDSPAEELRQVSYDKLGPRSSVKPLPLPVCFASFEEGAPPARRFVARLADEMCANLMRLNCEDLELLHYEPPTGGASVSSPRKAASEKIRGLFAQAASHSPCLICLENVAVFSSRGHSNINLGHDNATIIRDYATTATLFWATEGQTRPSKPTIRVPHTGVIADGRLGVVITCAHADVGEVHVRLAVLVHMRVRVAGGGASFTERRAFFHAQIRTRRRRSASATSRWFDQAGGDLAWFLDVTRGFSIPELEQLVDEAEEAFLARVFLNEGTPDGVAPSNRIERVDFDAPLRRREKARGDDAGAPKIPNVTWEDVGGLEDVKALIAESICMSGFETSAPVDEELSLADSSESRPKPYSTSSSWRRSGILMYGPPGCGKTLIAKAVANQFRMTFLSVKGPELLNQYVGQSEKNLRDVFARARAAAPSILFFDELDSMASSRGSTGDSGGVMDRMVSQLLAEMDAIQHDSNVVFVIAATNRPDLLDPCLMTPGRFDKSVLVGPARDTESKLRILRPVCQRMCLEPGLSVERIAEICSDVDMSGAELHGLMSRAAMNALRETIVALEAAAAHDDRRESRVSTSKAVNEDENELAESESDQNNVQITVSERHVQQALRDT